MRTTPAAPTKGYLPGMGHDWMLVLYDPLHRLLGLGSYHRTLLEQAGIQPGHRVLEIGCGTANLAVLAKRLTPDADLVGVDPDPKALNRARRKAARAGLSLRLDQGFTQDLPYPDASFDRVLSAFMFHHLQPNQKEKALREVRRVLTPTGSPASAGLWRCDSALRRPDGPPIPSQQTTPP